MPIRANKYIKNNVIIVFFKDIINFLTGRERSISFEFAFFMSLVIIIIIVSMGAYIQMAMNTLNNNVMLQSDNLKSSMSATIVSTIEDSLKDDDFKSIDKRVSHILSSRLVAYVIVADKQSGRVLYTSADRFTFNLSPGAYYPVFISTSNLRDADCIRIHRLNKTVYIGFFKDTVFADAFDKLLKQTPYLVIAFILMGLLLSYFFSKQIITLLGPMIWVTNQFEKGDLSNRMDETRYREINELVMSYNAMADTLQRLYSTLESQVQDRTKRLEVAYDELKNTQSMMVHSEKMKSLGELVAGIMHEINNPINFIYGNLSHLNNYSKDLIAIIDSYEKHDKELSQEHRDAIEKFKKDIDYEFLKSDLPDLIRSCQEGADRAKNIILDLKNFSRMEEVALTSVDIQKEIDTTLNILHNKMKHKVEVHKEYQDNLPKFEGYGGQLNQVFMNILDNAAFAIKEKGDIWIRLKSVDNSVIIEFEDNGIGMDETAVQKIFNPFFTTKPVGQGTGLGMSISYKVIQNHKGDIKVESEVGKGTKFTIKLPLNLSKELLAERKQEIISDELEIVE